MSNKIFEIVLKLRIASPEDLKINNHELRYGQPYWLKGLKSQKFEGPYIIDSDTDPYELAEWFNQRMIYVALKVLD